MVSNLQKELPCKVEKPKYKKLKVMQPRIENKSERPVWISLLVNDNEGEGWGLKKRGALTNYLLLKREDLSARGWFIEKRGEGIEVLR